MLKCEIWERMVVGGGEGEGGGGGGGGNDGSSWILTPSLPRCHLKTTNKCTKF